MKPNIIIIKKIILRVLFLKKPRKFTDTFYVKLKNIETLNFINVMTWKLYFHVDMDEM